MKIKSFIEGNILSNEALKKRRSVIIFIAFLFGINMYGIFESQRAHRKLAIIRDELMSLRARSAVNHAEKTSLTRESRINKMLSEYGIELQKSNDPPKKIE